MTVQHKSALMNRLLGSYKMVALDQLIPRIWDKEKLSIEGNTNMDKTLPRAVREVEDNIEEDIKRKPPDLSLL